MKFTAYKKQIGCGEDHHSELGLQETLKEGGAWIQNFYVEVQHHSISERSEE